MPAPAGLNIGDSVIDAFGLKKWEDVDEDFQNVSVKNKGRNAKKPPQGWTLGKYDIPGIRKYLNCLQEDEEIVLTEKCHGFNASYTHDGTELWTKSRNFFKKEDEDDAWWDLALRYDLKTKLAKYPMKAFYCEGIGKIPKFRYNAEVVNGVLHTKLVFYDIFDVITKRYLDYDERIAIFKELELDPVPELYRGKWLGKELMYPYAEGMSILNPKHIREGFVINTIKERYEPRLNSRMQLKCVGEAFNLQK